MSNVKTELAVREAKIKELNQDKVKLKNLLKKAKTAIDSINLKYKTSQERARGLEQSMGEL